MTINTKTALSEIQDNLDEQKDALIHEHEEMLSSIRQLKDEVSQIFTEQREEIVRLRIELERVYSEERRRRLAAIKRFRSE